MRKRKHIDAEENFVSDYDIIKSLRVCVDSVDCINCEFVNRNDCINELCKESLMLFRRQRENIRCTKSYYKKREEGIIAKARVEAIKEFAEKLKESAFNCDVSFGYGREHYTEAVAVLEIDNLVKEMTEGN